MWLTFGGGVGAKESSVYSEVLAVCYQRRILE